MNNKHECVHPQKLNPQDVEDRLSTTAGAYEPLKAHSPMAHNIMLLETIEPLKISHHIIMTQVFDGL